MAYEKKFKKPYANGWKNSPFKETPITAEVLNGYDVAIENIEAFIAAFSKQIERDYYGTGNGAPLFDLIPNGAIGAPLSRLGACYVSVWGDAEKYHAPYVGYAYAFGLDISRYGIIFVARDGNGVWFRTESTDWIRIFKNSVHQDSFTWVKTMTITFNDAGVGNSSVHIMTQEGNITFDCQNGSFRTRGGTTLTNNFSFTQSGNVLTVTFDSSWACGFIMSSKPFVLTTSQ